MLELPVDPTTNSGGSEGTGRETMPDGGEGAESRGCLWDESGVAGSGYPGTRERAFFDRPFSEPRLPPASVIEVPLSSSDECGLLEPAVGVMVGSPAGSDKCIVGAE